MHGTVFYTENLNILAKIKTKQKIILTLYSGAEVGPLDENMASQNLVVLSL